MIQRIVILWVVWSLWGSGCVAATSADTTAQRNTSRQMKYLVLDSLRSEGKFHNGKRHGYWRWYYPTGRLFIDAYYVDGKKDGRVRVFYPDGTLKQLEHYRDGVKHGILRYYFPSGQLEREEYYENGVLQDTAKYYYENGHLDMIIPYRNGKMHGLVRTFYPSGQIQSEEIFRTGVADSVSRFYAPGELLHGCVLPLDCRNCIASSRKFFTISTPANCR